MSQAVRSFRAPRRLSRAQGPVGELSSASEERATSPPAESSRKRRIPHDGVPQKEQQQQHAPRAKKTRKREVRPQDVEMPNSGATALRVELLPVIYDKIMVQLGEERAKHIIVDHVRRLISTCAMDTEKFCANSEDKLYEHCLQEVQSNLEAYSYSSALKGAALAQRTLEKTEDAAAQNGVSGARVGSALQRYSSLMDGQEMQDKRSYRIENHTWTPEELLRFEEALKLFPDGRRANRSIAEYIGGSVHPNHVVFLKSQYRMKERREKSASKAPARALRTPKQPVKAGVVWDARNQALFEKALSWVGGADAATGTILMKEFQKPEYGEQLAGLNRVQVNSRLQWFRKRQNAATLAPGDSASPERPADPVKSPSSAVRDVRRHVEQHATVLKHLGVGSHDPSQLAVVRFSDSTNEVWRTQGHGLVQDVRHGAVRLVDDDALASLAMLEAQYAKLESSTVRAGDW